MLSVALREDAWIPRRMAGPDDFIQQQRRRDGLALKILRQRSGMSQERAAERAEIGVQSWQNYEVGRRGMDAAKLDRVTAAIGSSAEEHALEVAKLSDAERVQTSRGFEDRARPFALPLGGIAYGGTNRPAVYDMSEPEVIDFAAYFTANDRVLRLAGMSMYPYADEGGFVTYNLRKPPRRGYGCVIEMKSGAYLVKRFERFEDDTLHVTELHPEEKPLQIALDEVRGVYAIGLRGD